MLWAHLCCLLQFWTDEAGYLEGNFFYGGLSREAEQHGAVRHDADEQPHSWGNSGDLEGCCERHSLAEDPDGVLCRAGSGLPPPTGSVRTERT